MNSAHPPTVLVGIDGSTTAEHALDWAAQEAELRGARLRIAAMVSPAAYDHAATFRGDLPRHVRTAAERALSAAAERVQATRPGLETATELGEAEPVEGLLRLSAQADLLVAGSRGLNAFLSVLIGSVSTGLAAHSAVPVVLAHGNYGGEAVVLGMAPDEPSAAIDFAFAEAQLRHVPLIAVRAWTPPQVFPGVRSLTPQEERDRGRREAEVLEADLAAARKSHPEVRVCEQVDPTVPEEALVEASGKAALVVIGRCLLRPRLSLPLGPVAHRVLHHAHAPVAVVPG